VMTSRPGPGAVPKAGRSSRATPGAVETVGPYDSSNCSESVVTSQFEGGAGARVAGWVGDENERGGD
jgi:hypothetical protein